MNEFLRRISFEDSRNQRALSPPIAASFTSTCVPEFVTHRLQTRYDLKFHFNQEAWVDGNRVNDTEYLIMVKCRFINAVEQFLFGKTMIALAELEMHIHNQDFDKALACLHIARCYLDGGNYE